MSKNTPAGAIIHCLCLLQRARRGPRLCPIAGSALSRASGAGLRDLSGAVCAGLAPSQNPSIGQREPREAGGWEGHRAHCGIVTALVTGLTAFLRGVGLGRGTIIKKGLVELFASRQCIDRLRVWLSEICRSVRRSVPLLWRGQTTVRGLSRSAGRPSVRHTLCRRRSCVLVHPCTLVPSSTEG